MDHTVQTFKDLRKGVFNERSKDLFLALLIAIIGFAGSYLVLGKSIQDSGKEVSSTGSTEITDFNLKYFSVQSDQAQKNNYNFHDEHLLIQGSMIVGSITRISNLGFNPEKLYLIDFGNGTRNRMTSPVMVTRYNSPGFYLVQCYVMVENTWQLMSAETITIRKGEANDGSGLP
jgi:hypothetical protein